MNFEKLSVYDSRIVQKEPVYACNKGGLSYSNGKFQSVSANSSSMSFNINVPSQNTFIDRNMNITATFRLTGNVKVVNPNGAAADIPAGTSVMKFGKDTALCRWPLNSMCSTLQATINDSTVTVNISDVLEETLRLVSDEHQVESHTTPTMLDTFALMDIAKGTNSNTLGNYNNYIPGSGAKPNGSWVVQLQSKNAAGAWVNADEIKTTADIAPNKDDSVPFAVQFTVTEPLMISPFKYNQYGDDTGLFGVNNIQILMNFSQSNVQRVLRMLNASIGTGTRTITDLQIASVDNAMVNVLFITPSLELDLPRKSTLPYMGIDRYIMNTGENVAAGGSQTLSSQTLVLPNIPDLIAVYVKKPSYESYEASWYLPPSKVSLSFNNYSGLLSSHTKEQLYKMSYDNGLNMPYQMWQGKAVGTAGNVQLVGGWLLLRPGKDFPLSTGQAPGVSGSFSIQLNMTVDNPSSSEVQKPVMYITTYSSGFFQSENGNSMVVKSPLTESDVIQAATASYDSEDMRRLVGGSFFSSLANAASKVASIAKRPEVRGLVKMGLSRAGPRGQAAKEGLEAIGYGKRSRGAGGLTGGVGSL